MLARRLQGTWLALVVTVGLATGLLAMGLLATALLATEARAAASPPAPAGTATAHPFGGISTVGALYPSLASPIHICTASVIRSPGRDLVLTAAHCVAGLGTGYMIAPGFHGGDAPYGRWTATAVYLDPAWVRSQDPRRDFAFLKIAPRRINGHEVNIQQVTGGIRLGTHAAAKRRVTIPAYPEGAANNPLTCTVPVYYDGIYPAFNCNPYVGGTSGAPWITRSRQGATEVGLIGGLHQGGCFSYTSYSPPFGAAIHRAYERAVAGGPGNVAPVAGGDGC
jgi:V8-like Glu-specific endopeptidase